MARPMRGYSDASGIGEEKNVDAYIKSSWRKKENHGHRHRVYKRSTPGTALRAMAPS